MTEIIVYKDKSNYVSVYKVLFVLVLSTDREFYLSECVSWLMLNVGQRNRDWEQIKDRLSRMTHGFTFERAEDATAFKLRFGL